MKNALSEFLKFLDKKRKDDVLDVVLEFFKIHGLGDVKVDLGEKIKITFLAYRKFKKKEIPICI